MPTVSVNFANITRVVRNGTDYNQLEIRGTQVASKQLWRRVYINSSYPVTEYIDPPPYYERIQESKSFYSYNSNCTVTFYYTIYYSIYIYT
jgi:hypothetical protein